MIILYYYYMDASVGLFRVESDVAAAIKGKWLLFDKRW